MNKRNYLFVDTHAPNSMAAAEIVGRIAKERGLEGITANYTAFGTIFDYVFRKLGSRLPPEELSPMFENADEIYTMREDQKIALEGFGGMLKGHIDSLEIPDGDVKRLRATLENRIPRSNS